MKNSDPSGLSSPAVSPQKTIFQEFLLAEYDNIAEAHHNTVKSISEFFKHYVLIMSLPISAFVLLLRPSEGSEIDIEHLFVDRPEVILLFTIFVTLIGLTVLGYVSNLRCDALLYARAVNGIRRYFSDLSELPVGTYRRILVLPRSTYVPPYHEPSIFGFVVFTFALLGTGYLWGGLYLFYRIKVWHMDWQFHTFVLVVLLCTHYAVYFLVTFRRRTDSMSSRPTIGVDIDGVLNDHRRHFSTVLARRLGKELDPEQISTIPVHEIPGTNITIEDEHAVFNWPQYWTEMPVLPDVPETIKKLRKLGYEICLFTYRPWPQLESESKGRKKDYLAEWKKENWMAAPGYWNLFRRIERVLGKRNVLTSKIIKKLTARWLDAANIEYDYLFVETAYAYTADPWARPRNRFSDSIQRNSRYFVEDDLYKAVKLAYICDVVFLMNHPYNSDDPTPLPRNVIRVQSWKDIYAYIRRL